MVGAIFVAIKKQMYGLPQAGLLAQELLAERLGNKGYYQSCFSPGMWLHKTRSVAFTLCVENFGVKYTKEEDKEHLINLLQQIYGVTVDKEGE